MIENYGFHIFDIFLTLPYITLEDQKMFHHRAEISYNNNPSRCSPPAIVQVKWIAQKQKLRRHEE